VSVAEGFEVGGSVRHNPRGPQLKGASKLISCIEYPEVCGYAAVVEVGDEAVPHQQPVADPQQHPGQLTKAYNTLI